jgi:hypothetical protein
MLLIDTSERKETTQQHPGRLIRAERRRRRLRDAGLVFGILAIVAQHPADRAPGSPRTARRGRRARRRRSGRPGAQADMRKMEAKQPDVIAFNGYANQYKNDPIVVRKGESIRMFVLNSGPSIWSAFHVIGTVFDRTHIEGVVGRHAQTVNLAPSQGGWVEFTLDEEGTYPFVTHAFGDMVKGAVGVLATEQAHGAGMHH